MQNLQNAIRHNSIIMLSAETRNKNTSYRSISKHIKLFLEMRQDNSEDVRIKLSLLTYAKTFLFAPDIIHCFHSVSDALSISIFSQKGLKIRCSLNLTWKYTWTILRAQQWQGCSSRRSLNYFQISMAHSTVYWECRQNTCEVILNLCMKKSELDHSRLTALNWSMQSHTKACIAKSSCEICALLRYYAA